MSTEKIKEYIGTQLKALTSIASPTGFTKNATDYLMKQLEAMGYAPQLSNKGNVSVEIGGEGAPLVLAAHVDTLGAMVRSIRITDVCARQLSVVISGAQQMEKTAWFLRVMAECTQAWC